MESTKVLMKNPNKCAAQTMKKLCAGCLEAQAENDEELATIRRGSLRFGRSEHEEGEDLGSTSRL